MWSPQQAPVKANPEVTQLPPKRRNRPPIGPSTRSSRRRLCRRPSRPRRVEPGSKRSASQGLGRVCGASARRLARARSAAGSDSISDVISKVLFSSPLAMRRRGLRCEEDPRRHLAKRCTCSTHAMRIAEGTPPVAVKADRDCDSETPLSCRDTGSGSALSAVRIFSIPCECSLGVNLANLRVYFRIDFGITRISVGRSKARGHGKAGKSSSWQLDPHPHREDSARPLPVRARLSKRIAPTVSLHQHRPIGSEVGGRTAG